MSRDVFDLVVIGGGIVGLATAYRWGASRPDDRIAILEKESQFAQHQTGHNSGVLHTGIYYRPGSRKAENCRVGKLAMQRFCDEHGIPYQLCGKVIVATSESELPRLQDIYQRGQQNGVRCELIGPERLAELEPHAAGLRAIHVPDAGIVDYGAVCQQLGQIVSARGGRLISNARVETIRLLSDSVQIGSTAGDFKTRRCINCAGLYSDKVAALSGVEASSKIVPFRGEYYELQPSARHLCRGLIYPVPDPAFPFLGVHFTRMINDSVECGPNAVLALAREGYRWRDIRLSELTESLMYRGFQRLALRYWRVGLGEVWRSASKRAFVRALQRLIPEIRSRDLLRAPAGVRAQAIRPDGEMVDDFEVLRSDRITNVCNAPSPAATSSLNIGQWIVEEALGDRPVTNVRVT